MKHFLIIAVQGSGMDGDRLTLCMLLWVGSLVGCGGGVVGVHFFLSNFLQKVKIVFLRCQESMGALRTALS